MKFKHLLCSILTLMLILTRLVLPASANDQLPTLVISDRQYPESMEQAAAELREGIKSWENFITVTFAADSGSFDGTKASANDLANQVLDLALAHTGVPDEGDYLRFNIGYMEPNSLDFTKQSDGWQFTVTYYIVYWTTAEQEEEVDTQIEALVQSLDLRNSQFSDYQKVSAIYHYICENVDYDYENLEDDTYGLKFTTYAAAVQKYAVCQGYSTLFYRLALEAGVDNRVITGYTGEDHSWNTVKLDGYYYNLDSTWDAEGYDFRFFLKSANEFFDHDPDPEYETPDFLAAYPPAKISYQLPDLENAFDGDFEYRVVGGLAALLKYHGTDTDVIVPAMLGGYPVNWIASCAFYDNPNIISLTFSEGIQIMESEAILECPNLKSVHLPSTVDFTGSKDPDFRCNVCCGPRFAPSMETITVAEGNPYVVVVDNVLYSKDMTILRYFPAADPREVFEIPEGVISIGAFAFNNAQNLKEVIMPDTVRMINFGAFEEITSLEKINISNSCRQISQYVFNNTSLESIHIPASMEWLYGASFGIDCKLKAITVDPDNPYYYAEDNVLYANYMEGVNTDSCHIPGKWLVKYPAGSDAISFTIPEGVLGIEQNAFDSSASLTEIILPDSLHTISPGAFWYCSGLTKMELPDNLKKIYNDPFNGCINLVELVIPASVESLDYYLVSAYGNPSLEQVVFLGDMPEMFFETFQWCNLDIYYSAGNTTYLDAIQMNTNSNRWKVGCGDNFDLTQMQMDYENVRWHEACAIHQFVSKTVEATCTLSSYTGQECSVCGLLEVTGNLIPALGHDLVLDHVEEQSCEWPGITVYRCTRCQEWVYEDYVDPLGHDYDENGNCTRCRGNQTQALNSTQDMQALLPTLLIIAAVAILLFIGIMLLLLRRK